VIRDRNDFNHSCKAAATAGRRFKHIIARPCPPAQRDGTRRLSSSRMTSLQLPRAWGRRTCPRVRHMRHAGARKA
jgi:hypothetical protein